MEKHSMEVEQSEAPKSWLVGSLAGESLVSLAERIAQDPEVTLERIVGPAESPRLLVVSMTESAVARYRQEFGDAVLFEENAPLYPLNRAG